MPDRTAEDRNRLLRLADSVRILADAFEHSELIFAVVNVSASGIQISGSDVACHMQQRRTAIPRFDDRARGVAGARAGTCEGDAELSRDARIRVGHIDGGSFV